MIIQLDLNILHWPRTVSEGLLSSLSDVHLLWTGDRSSIRAGVQPNTGKPSKRMCVCSPESLIRVHRLSNTLLLKTMKPKSLCVPRLGLFEAGRYRRQVDPDAPEQIFDPPAEKRPRDLRFTLLSERSPYEPLVEDDSQHKLKEERNVKKKEKYKKYRKVRWIGIWIPCGIAISQNAVFYLM